MSNFLIVDIEADGQIPGDYSMICFGAVVVNAETRKITDKYYSGYIQPVSTKFDLSALSAIGLTRKDYLYGEHPVKIMNEFKEFILRQNSKLIFVSDNNGFDWSFINWYFHHFLGANPLGWSSRRIGDIYCGYKKDLRATWKNLRNTKHTHNPLDDATGNAEAFIKILDMMKTDENKDQRVPIWTKDEVVVLYWRQRDPMFHPYTCPNRDEHPVLDNGKGILIPTIYGLICQHCDYVQTTNLDL